MRLDYDEAHEPSASARVDVPTGVALFPRELIKSPRAWVAQRFNLVRWSLQARGGHFAALEMPQLLLADLRAFAAQLQGRPA